MRTIMSYFNDYVRYLMDYVDAPKNYWLLFNEMLHIDFRVCHDTKELSMDSNRSSDGLRLREEFIRDVVPGSHEMEFRDFIGAGCTVLEMMIALCDRMERHVSDRRKEELFWEMLENLGIDDYTDEAMEKEESYYDNLHYILGKLNGRSYRRDGKGGCIFVINDIERCGRNRKDDFDLRKMEIWRQANLYCRLKEGDFG